jgi:hypothetical protein
VEIYAGSDIKENGKPLILKPNEKAVVSKLRLRKAERSDFKTSLLNLLS